MIDSRQVIGANGAGAGCEDGAFQDAGDELALRLRDAVGGLSRRLRPTAAGSAHGLTPTSAAVLLAIVRERSIAVSDLAAREGLHPTLLSRTLSALIAAGLVERACGSTDRRRAWVRATARGRRVAQRMRHERAAAVAAALASLSEEQRACIERSLPALEELALKLPEAGR